MAGTRYHKDYILILYGFRKRCIPGKEVLVRSHCLVRENEKFYSQLYTGNPTGGLRGPQSS